MQTTQPESILPGMYRHYKGGMYEVLGVAPNVCGEADYVVCRRDGKLWVRPFNNFTANVERNGYSGPRFVLVEEEAKERATQDELLAKWVEDGERKSAPIVDPAKFGPHQYSDHDYTSDCLFGCGCWAGPVRSGGPVYPFGACPKNPLPTESLASLRADPDRQVNPCRAIAFILPWPPSVNSMYRRRRDGQVRCSPEVKSYKEAAARSALSQGVRPFVGPVAVVLELYPPREGSDTDGRVKVTLDALENVAWANDRQVKDIRAVMHDADKIRPRVEVRITTMEGR